MDHKHMRVFHTQLFQFWYSMGFLPYLGLDETSNMTAALVRLLRALELQQPVSDRATAKSLADAEWAIKNIMLDCIDKAESLLRLAHPSSTSLDGRLVEISIALAALLDKVKLAQKCEEDRASRGLPPSAGTRTPPPLWARPEFSSGSVYNSSSSTPSSYHNGIYPAPFTPPPGSRLATLKTMHDEYFRGAFDSASMDRACLFDKLRLMAPDAAFSYASAIHDDSFQAIVCCVAGWGLGHCAMALPEGRLEKLTYNQLVSMLMLCGTSLHHASSPLHRAQVEVEAARAARVSQPQAPSIFPGTALPLVPLGPAKPPLFRSVAPGPGGPGGPAPFLPASGLPPPMQSMNRNSYTYIPPNRPPWVHGFFRKPGPTGVAGRPPLFQPHQPYSLPPGSRHCPMPIAYGMPRRGGYTVPNRMPLPSRRNKQSSIVGKDSAGNATKPDSEASDTSSNSSDGSVLSDSDSDNSISGSDSDSDSDSGRARRRRSLSSAYAASVVDDDHYADGLSDSEACACLYGKGRKSKECSSARCIYDDMTEEERKQNKYATKQKAKRAKMAAKKEAQKVKEAKEKANNKKSSLDKEDWDALSDDAVDSDADADVLPTTVKTLKAIKAGSVCSLSESGSVSDSGSGSGPGPDAATVDIFGWMKQGKLGKKASLALATGAEEAAKKEKTKKAKKAAKDSKDSKAKHRGSFVVVGQGGRTDEMTVS